MHQRGLSELQGVSAQQGVVTQRTSGDRVRWSRVPRRGPGGLCPPRGPPLWAWLLLAALVVPGARSFLSEEQEELLVELHNHYRGQVSPSASAMLPLKWDPGLKLIAEGYAAKCIWNHNPELEDTGENLFAGTGPLDLREALEKWFLEHLDYDFHNNSCDEDKMCGHYTQMVWADTHRVGCAFHLCSSMEGLDWERVSFLVCNYYPAGNYEDQRPYVEGDWCSRCPDNLQKCENNLCVADTEEEDEVEGDVEGEVEEGVEEGVEEVVVEGVVEEETVVVPPATSAPSLPPPEEEQEEEKEVIVPATTNSAPSSPSTTTTTTTTTSLHNTEDSRFPATQAPGTSPPHVPSTTLGSEDEEEEEEGQREEAIERDASIKVFQNTRVHTSAGSVCSPSVLSASLTVILTLRL